MGPTRGEAILASAASLPGGLAGVQAHLVLGGAIEQCPACRSARIEAVTREVDAKYRCGDCGRCWTCVFAGVYRVNPVECPGCAHRDTCFELLREDFTGWWSLPGLEPVDVPAPVDHRGADDGGGDR
jgi:hypothetical protein